MALEQVSRIDRLLVQNQLPLSEVLLNPIATNIKTKSELIEKNVTEITKTWGEYMATYLTPEEKLLADKLR